MAIAEFTTAQKSPTDSRPRPALRVVNIHDQSARECEQVLSEILALVRAGRIVGLNWSAVTEGREIISGRAGVMKRDEGMALISSFRKAVDIISGQP